MRKIIYLTLPLALLFCHSFAQTPTALAIQDTRNTATTPSSYSQNLQAHFKLSGTIGLPQLGGGYYALLGLRGWYADGGGKAHELAFGDDNQIRFRSGYDAGWEPWIKILAEKPNGYLGLGTTAPSEKLHIEEGKMFIQAPPLGTGNSSGALLKMGAYSYSLYHAGLGVTQGEGVDVLDLDFYTMHGTSSAKMKLTSFGSLGVGGIYPLHKLHVNGNIGFGDNSYISPNNGYTRFFTSGNQPQGIQAGAIAITDNYAEQAPTYGMYIKGNVGIGTANLPPGAKLAVNGDIYAKKIKVTQAGWPDYVFDNDYHLPSLGEVEAYIKFHKHLPGLVSAKQVAVEGLDLGDNQAALLKKIEELTLYLIEMKKQIDSQQKQIAELKAFVEK